MSGRTTGMLVAVALGLVCTREALRAQAPTEKVPIVAVAGCLAEQGENNWMLTRATEPEPSIANGPPAGQPYKGPTSGKNTFKLIGVSEYDLPSHKGHTVLVKNDNLSGMTLATFLAKTLQPLFRRYTYRFLFIPGAIGSITWLAQNQPRAARIKHGLVVTGVGDSGPLHYKRSRRGEAEIDRAVEHVLKHSGQPYQIRDFSPYGYDERQYCSPGFNLAVGALTRTPHGQYPQYHTSADNLDFISSQSLADTLSAYLAVLRVLEGNRLYRNLIPKCEVRLGKRGLYRSVGGQTWMSAAFFKKWSCLRANTSGAWPWPASLTTNL